MSDFITLICDKCKKEYQIKKKIYNQRLRRGTPNYCKECMKIYSVETVKNAKANMTDERKLEYSKKLSDANKQYWKNLDNTTKEIRFDQLRKQNDELQRCMTPEKLKEISIKRAIGKSKMTDKQIEQMKEKMSKSMNDHHANMSLKEKELFSQQIKAGMNRMSDNEKQEMKDSWINWWNSLTEEERYIHIKKLNDNRDNWINNLSDEDKNERSKKLNESKEKWWNNLSDEEKLAITSPKVQKWHEGRDKWWNSLTEEEKNKHSGRLTNYWNNLMPDEKAAFTRKRLSLANGKNKLHQKFETRFNESHLSNEYYIKPEVVLYNDNVIHSWDYGIYNKSNNQLEMVVDLDGAYFHADGCDYDGLHSKEEYDERRTLSIPSSSKIKYFIIQETNFAKCFELMLKMLMKNYDEYVEYIFKMCRSMPFPYHKYTDAELINSYKNLCKMDCDDKYHQDISLNTRLGDRLIQHFHESIYQAHTRGNISPYEAWYIDELLLKVIRNRIIYQTYLNSNKILQGFNISKTATKVSVFSAGRAKILINKYLNKYDTIFDPFSGFSGRMLGTISLGKRYIGQDISDIHVKESNDIIKFLEKYCINVNADICQKDILQSTGEYDCLFTCPPYADKEQWKDVPISMNSCDDWIDVCLSHFKCKTYLFVVDITEKYKDNIIEVLDNESHFGNNSEYAILIKNI